jgi:outer membrane immunogenic protein
MRRRLFAAGLFALATAGQAAAADLSIPPPPSPGPAPFFAPAYNWGGFYVGLNGGFGMGQSDWKVPPTFDTDNFTVSGGLFGGMVGENIQYDAIVFGVEGDFDGSWIKGQTTNCLPIACETRND